MSFQELSEVKGSPGTQVLNAFGLCAGVANHDVNNIDMLYSREFHQYHQRGLPNGEHILLHFDAVDHAATVYLNGHKLGTHEGGLRASPLFLDRVVRAPPPSEDNWLLLEK